VFYIIEHVVITHQPGDGEDTMYIPEGTSLQLECRAFGLPPPRYVWFLGNEELREQTSNILLIRDFRYAFCYNNLCLSYVLHILPCNFLVPGSLLELIFLYIIFKEVSTIET